MSKQSPPAPTASAIGPCPTIIHINKMPRNWKFTQHHLTTRLPQPIEKGGDDENGRVAYPESVRIHLTCLQCRFFRPRGYKNMLNSAEHEMFLLINVKMLETRRTDVVAQNLTRPNIQWLNFPIWTKFPFIYYCQKDKLGALKFVFWRFLVARNKD